MKKNAIIIVDDVKSTRMELTFFLNQNPEIEIIGEAENGQVFLDLLHHKKPDIVLMDIQMPVLNGIDATEQAISQFSDLKVIAITSDDTNETVEKMIFAGAKGFLTKPVEPIELQKAIKTILKGGTYFSPNLKGLYALKIAYISSKN